LKPQIPLGEGLQRTVAWYREQLERSPEMQKAIEI
jgi:nucleoside-diphosphate-sugar epimerase